MKNKEGKMTNNEKAFGEGLLFFARKEMGKGKDYDQLWLWVKGKKVTTEGAEDTEKG